MGAFKFRGAFNALSRFDERQRRAGVVAFSSGNHAQAVSLAASLLGMPAVIVMPHDAPAAKVAATQGYGGEVVVYDRYREDREAIGRKLAEERGMTLIPPYDHADIIAGQGTAVKELIEEVGELDALFVRSAAAACSRGRRSPARALSPRCRIYGVEPEAGNDGQQSFRSGRIVTIATPRTIADGAQTLHLGELTFPIIRRDVDDVVTASDAELVDAMRFFAERMKLVVEPTGALGFACGAADGFRAERAARRHRHQRRQRRSRSLRRAARPGERRRRSLGRHGESREERRAPTRRAAGALHCVLQRQVQDVALGMAAAQTVRDRRQAGEQP
jgi:threonine dehydratase